MLRDRPRLWIASPLNGGDHVAVILADEINVEPDCKDASGRVGIRKRRAITVRGSLSLLGDLQRPGLARAFFVISW
jgi:hypothetical protein